MTSTPSRFRVGDKVVVPWGVSRNVPGTVVEVWNDRLDLIRVHLHFDDRSEDLDAVVLLLKADWVSAADDGTALPSSA